MQRKVPTKCSEGSGLLLCVTIGDDCSAVIIASGKLAAARACAHG